MEIFYILDQKDYLAFQLFSYSTSARNQKTQKRNNRIIPALYIVLGLLLLLLQDQILGTIFIVLGILWFIFYPNIQKKRLEKHFTNFIHEHYGQRIGQKATLKLSDDYFYLIDQYSESKTKIEALEALYEIQTHYFLKLQNGVSLIIPKDGVSSPTAMNQIIAHLKNELKVPYHALLDWEWQ